MYYRKYFSGSIESNTAYRLVQNIVNTANTYDYYNQTDVVCSAIKSTLEDVEIQCEYDETSRTLVIDGVTIQILVYNQNGYIGYYANGITLGQVTYTPFSGLNYKFYVTLKGDKDGMLQIFIGYFSIPAAEVYGFVIGKGTDLKDGQDIRVASGNNISSVGAVYILKNDAILPECKTQITFGQQFTYDSVLTNSGKEITLVECVALPGRFRLNNCYCGSGGLTVGEFYNIGGDIYYYISKNILVKCVSEQAS